MYFLIYVSSATFDFTEADLLQLLEQSRDDNRELGITGMLLYKGGNFMRVLEGEREAVTAIFEKIRVDKRHKGVIVVMEDDIEQRQFPEWSMGFKLVECGETINIPGYTNFLDYAFDWSDLKTQPSVCQRLLLSFRNNLR